MRTSFQMALGASGIAIATTLLTSSKAFVVGVWIVALGLIALYATHLVVYSIRATVAPIRGKKWDLDTLPNVSRRHAFKAFAKTLGMVAVATALPTYGVFAQSDDPYERCADRCYNTEKLCIARCDNGPQAQAVQCIGNCQIDRAQCTSNCG